MKKLFKVEKQTIISSHLCNRAYISQNLFDMLIVDGIHLITKIRNNMKKPFWISTTKYYYAKEQWLKPFMANWKYLSDWTV